MKPGCNTKAPNDLSSQLRRLAPAPRGAGITVTQAHVRKRGAIELL